MKVRCSGTSPCSRCERSKTTCDFQSSDPRVSITRSYLRSLEDKARGNNPERVLETAVQAPGSGRTLAPAPIPNVTGTHDRGSTEQSQASEMTWKTRRGSTQPRPLVREPGSTKSSTGALSSEQPVISHEEFIKNPLIDSDETFAVGSDGKFWYLGPTSSWSFCRRVLAMIASRLSQSVNPPDPWTLDRFDLRWSPLGLDEQPAVNDLPSQDYAVYLARLVKYNLGTLSPIIDDNVFFEKVNDFYQDPAVEAKRSKLWYAEFLLVIAFGQAILNSDSGAPFPNTKYAARALSLIPNFFRINSHSMLAVETLCLASLYLQSLDLRLEAFQLIGQALRLCTLEGFHRHASASEVGETTSKRYNTLFWATYTLDRYFAALVGAPSSIRDEDITAKLPSEILDSVWATAMTLNIRLSRLTADILAVADALHEGVYGMDSQADGTLIHKTQTMLHSIADVSIDLDAFFQSGHNSESIKSSKTATRLLLSCHHCVVLTTRPLVMCVLQKCLAHGCTEASVLEGPASSLIQTCVDSASKILVTLKDLSDSEQLDCFISFQLEEAFSSAVLLHVINAITPSFIKNRVHLSIAHHVFDKMMAKGSHGARVRKTNLQRLERMLFYYSQSIDKEAMRSASNPHNLRQCSSATEAFAYGPVAGDESGWDSSEFREMSTISPTLLLTLAEGLELEHFV